MTGAETAAPQYLGATHFGGLRALLVRGNSEDHSTVRPRSPTMASKKNVHTTPNPNGNGWVNSVNSKPTSVTHRTQATAVRAGRDIARQGGGEHSIHRTDGTIGKKNSYGNDSNPPKDKNR